MFCYKEQLLACTCITLWCILLSKVAFFCFFLTINENVFNYDKDKSNKRGRQKYNPRSASHKAAQVCITVLYCIISTACWSLQSWGCMKSSITSQLCTMRCECYAIAWRNNEQFPQRKGRLEWINHVLVVLENTRINSWLFSASISALNLHSRKPCHKRTMNMHEDHYE